MMLAGLSAWHAGATQIVVARLRSDAKRAAGGDGAPLPAVRAPGPGRARRSRSARWRPRCRSSGRCRQKDGRATAFVCRDFACREPVTTPDALAAQLQRAHEAPVHVAFNPRPDPRRLPPLSPEREHRHRGDDPRARAVARHDRGESAPEAGDFRRGGRGLQLRREHPGARARRDRARAARGPRADLRAARSADRRPRRSSAGAASAAASRSRWRATSSSRRSRRVLRAAGDRARRLSAGRGGAAAAARRHGAGDAARSSPGSRYPPTDWRGPGCSRRWSRTATLAAEVDAGSTTHLQAKSGAALRYAAAAARHALRQHVRDRAARTGAAILGRSDADARRSRRHRGFPRETRPALDGSVTVDGI